MKKCTICKFEKDKSEFYKDSKKTDGLQTRCKECCKTSNSSRYAKNKESHLAAMREYRLKNRAKISARRAEYYSENIEKIMAYYFKYMANNKEKLSAAWRNRRVKRGGAEGTHTSEDVRRIFNLQQGICANCKIKLVKSGKQKYHVDHIIPLARGGTNWPSNLQCLCPFCNLSKSAKDPIDWANQNGRLI
jgi:5-methylcytosine-specific restriction endonuclease McrA